MRSPLRIVLLFTSLTAAALAQGPPDAQDEPRRPDSRFHIGLGVAAGQFRFETDGSNLDDSTDAGMFRLDFEATSPRGIGGGIRFEGTTSDDDLFAGTGFSSAEARHGSIFAHFTYRLQQHRFAIPMRVGLLYDGLTLEDDTSDKVEYGSFGVYFEIEPEVVLVQSGRTHWSLYGQLGFGFAGTDIEVKTGTGSGTLTQDFDSGTGFFGLEVGTRIQLGVVEIGVAYIGRWQSMDESDPEAGLVALGYDADFQGLMATFAVVF